MSVKGNELTEGPVMSTMLRFAVPMIIGDLLQQCYNIADTIIVGRFLGTNPLAAVGSAFSLMTFLTSILLGLAMGSGTVFSMRFGRKDEKGLRESVLSSFVLLAAVNAVLNIIVFAGCDLIIQVLQIPQELTGLMKEYLIVIFAGLTGIFLYNFFASLLRSLGNSKVPTIFLAVSALLNIVLDLCFVAGLDFGVAGAAWATVISQYVSGIGIAVYTGVKFPSLLRPDRSVRLRISSIKEIAGFSSLTCLQQSIMNLGILAVQGRVNSFGPVIMAAFAAGVKIDAFAYLPVQDFGNAFSYFISQNYGAGEKERIARGIKTATVITISFGIVLSLFVCLFADSLIALFIDDSGSAALVIEEGRGTLPPHRRCLLLSYRSAFPALRAVQGTGTPRHVCCTDCHLAWPQSCACICSFSSAFNRSRGNMVVGSHRLGHCRCCRNHILHAEKENPPFLKFVNYNQKYSLQYISHRAIFPTWKAHLRLKVCHLA